MGEVGAFGLKPTGKTVAFLAVPEVFLPSQISKGATSPLPITSPE